MTAAAAAVAGMRCVLVLTATSDRPAVAGNLLLDKLYGAVSAGEPEKIERAKGIANEAATRLGLPDRLEVTDLVTDQGYIGEGYGIPTAEALEAIELVAKTEAILLDPCYTSKAMAALIDHVRRGELSPNETVVFLHTGGMPALFTPGFADALQARH